MKNYLYLIIMLLVIAPVAHAGDIKPDPATGSLNTEGCRLSVGDKRTPSPPVDIAAIYDLSYEEIYLVWSQHGDVPVCYWQVYYSLTSGGPYHKLGRADNNGRSQQAFFAPLAVVPPGDAATIHLVVVSFRSDAIYSPKSREAYVIVNRVQKVPDNAEPPSGQTGGEMLLVQNFPVMAQAVQHLRVTMRRSTR